MNRHLKDIGRDVDIVREKQFKSSNGMLDANLKQNLKQCLSRPTQHYPVLPKVTLTNSRIISMERIRFCLGIGSGTCSPYTYKHTLCKSWYWVPPAAKILSFLICEDESGNKYITTFHETCQKNIKVASHKRARNRKISACLRQAVKIAWRIL